MEDTGIAWRAVFGCDRVILLGDSEGKEGNVLGYKYIQPLWTAYTMRGSTEREIKRGMGDIGS